MAERMRQGLAAWLELCPQLIGSAGCPTYTAHMPKNSVSHSRRADATPRMQDVAVPAASTSPQATPSDAELDPHVRELLSSFDLTGVVSHLLRRAHFLAEDLFAREFADEGLTPRQKAVLITLYQEPGLNQNGLAERLHMDRNTVAEMVRRLVSAGWIDRRPAPGDQRAYQLFLAAQGAQVLNRVMPRDVELEKQIIERLPPEYRALFLKCLRLLVATDETGAKAVATNGARRGPAVR